MVQGVQVSRKLIQRWSENKHKQRAPSPAVQPLPLSQGVEPRENDQKDELNENSDPLSLAQLLVSTASEEVKKLALRELFSSGEFHAVDPLDDYAHDYRAVKNLSAEVSQTLRQWLNEPSDEKDASSTAAVADNLQHEEIEAKSPSAQSKPGDLDA